jgi:hypothetical protein
MRERWKSGIVELRKSDARLEKESSMTRQLDNDAYGTFGLHPENAFNLRQAQPAKTCYTWKEVFGDAGDESPIPDQACEVDLARFQEPEIATDEFEAVYLWFLA